MIYAGRGIGTKCDLVCGTGLEPIGSFGQTVFVFSGNRTFLKSECHAHLLVRPRASGRQESRRNGCGGTTMATHWALTRRITTHTTLGNTSLFHGEGTHPSSAMKASLVSLPPLDDASAGIGFKATRIPVH
ncbi:unnamed protein product, partial [Ectocarpus sp. 13 AM-2016]